MVFRETQENETHTIIVRTSLGYILSPKKLALYLVLSKKSSSLERCIAIYITSRD